MKIRILFALLLMTITAAAQKLTVDGWRLQTNAAITGTLSVSNAIIGQGNAQFFQNVASAGSGQFIGNGASVTNILHGFITPYDVGAVGDGVTDDSAALKAWLFIGCSSNWICFLPPAPGGSYACSTTLLITNGMNYVNIMGAGGPVMGSDSIKSACTIKITAAVDGIRITNSASNIRIEGINITNSGPFSAATHGLWLDGNTTDNDLSSWKNIGVSGFGTNMMVSSGADMLIENCSPAYGGDGLVIGPGTYSAVPVINQIHVRNCQLSYNTNVQCHVFYGQDVLIENGDLSPQSWAVGTGALFVEGHGVVTVAYMHTETYNGKPALVVTDRGNGAGSCTLRIVGVTSQADGSPGPTSYTLVNTNCTVTVQNSAFSDVADGSFAILWSSDSTLPNWRSDSPIKSRIIAGGGTIATNYLPVFPAFNVANVSANVQEGQMVHQFQDYNGNPGGGIGGGYIWSHLWYGARTFDADNSLTTTPIDLLGYYNDRALNGAGISSTNGFFTGNGTSRTPILTNFTAYSSGTVYTMTASFAQVVFGTTSPTVTFNNGGTYLVYAGANFTARGATYAATNTISIKLRKTTGTPADLANSTISETMPIITTVSEGLGELTAPPVLFTAAAADVVQLQATLSATPAAGNVICDAGYVVAIRLY